MTDEADLERRREEFIRAFGEPKTERDRRTLAAFLEGLEAAKPRAARESAMAGARRRRFKRTKKEE